VLISGRGSNLRAIAEAAKGGLLGARVALVVSNRADAKGLEFARQAGLETLVVPHRDFASRDLFDAALIKALHGRGVRLVCLAGFMRVLGSDFCAAFPNAILNIHPSLLPAFPGDHAVRQAIEHGVKVSGATVHFVTTDLDGGPIVAQEAVPVRNDDDADRLAARILEVEHRLYPEAIRRVAAGGWRLVGRRVVWDRKVSSGRHDG
jgi:phosphoribosylglycinamide formyltransferase-1